MKKLNPIPEEIKDDAAFRCSVHTWISQKHNFERCENDSIGVVRDDLAEMYQDWMKNMPSFRREFYFQKMKYTFMCKEHALEFLGEDYDKEGPVEQ